MNKTILKDYIYNNQLSREEAMSAYYGTIMNESIYLRNRKIEGLSEIIHKEVNINKVSVSSILKIIDNIFIKDKIKLLLNNFHIVDNYKELIIKFLDTKSESTLYFNFIIKGGKLGYGIGEIEIKNTQDNYENKLLGVLNDFRKLISIYGEENVEINITFFS